MPGLGATEVVRLWERGVGLGPTERALLVLASAHPDRPLSELARLTIGRRDALLRAVREETVGRRFEGRVECPSCHELLEFAIDTTELGLPADGDEHDASPDEATAAVQVGDVEVVVRAPTSDDLIAVAAEGDAATAAAKLAESCLVSLRRNGRDLAGDGLTAAVRQVMSAALASADPLADLAIEMRCAACGHVWDAPLDIASVFWTEITAAAERLFHEVDTLARAYTWHESEILSMSAARRHRYIELATS
jgi:hypothetical protein